MTKKISLLQLTLLGLAIVIIVLAYHINLYQSKITKLLVYTNELNSTLIQQKENIFLPLKIKDYTIPEKSSFQELQNKIVLLFPEDICNVCHEKIFYNIENLKDEQKKDIVTIVPLKFKRNFSIYNKEYNLKLSNIIYSNSFLDLSEQINNKLLIFYCSKKLQIMAPIILDSNNSALEEYILKIHKL